MAIECHLFLGGRERHTIPLTDVSAALRRKDALLWVDLEEPSEQEIARLGVEFGFHPLALEDCLHPHQRPKVESYDGSFFLVAYGLSGEPGALREHEIAAFAGGNYFVTVRKSPAFDIAPVRRRWAGHETLAREGGGSLLYMLLDEIVDRYFDTVDHFQDRIADTEEAVIGGIESEALRQDLFRLRKELLWFRRRVAPLREVLDVLTRTPAIVTAGLAPYYRDVYDHVLRATDFIDTARESLSVALESYLTVVSNRLNTVMRTMTAWGAIILVPTLIAGIYGMNFAHMPELDWRLGYPFSLGLMGASALTLWRTFRRRGWL